MKTTTLAIVAAMAAGTLVHAGTNPGGFARFTQPSDTIRIQGNTVFPGTDWTYEIHIRLDLDLPASGSFGIVSEQRDTFEDKGLGIANGEFVKNDTRGANCGSPAAISPVPADVPGHWRHLAWVRSGSTLTLYIDGLIDSQWTSTPTCTGNHPGSWMSIGMFRYGAGYIPGPILPSFRGDLDWIRISRVARYAEAFVPPCESDVTADADTELLLRFNEGPGAAIFIDESPNAWLCEPGVPVHPGVTATPPEFILGGVDGPPACQDCDNNGVSDADEIAAGVPDCNGNGIPDNCDYEGLYVTPQQAPFGAGNFLSHTFTDVDLATEDVSVMVEVRGDLDSTTEFATLKIDGETIEVLWVVGGLNCPADGKVIELVIPASEFNAFAKDGEVNVVLEASPLVSPTECADSFARVSIQYATTFPDCNGNGLDDNCEIADGTLTDCDGNGIPDSCDTSFPDCNANGVPDSCDIADGTLLDCNGNGQPDSCEVASWPDLDCDGDGQLDECQIASNAALDENEDGILDACSFALGDFDLDGIVGGSDLAVLLSLWGSKNPPIGDLTGDGAIDGADLASLLGNWGPYQGVWGSIIEILPDPAVVTDPEWRERIIATGHPWRVRHTKSDIEMLLVPPGTFMMGCSPSLDHPCATDGREEPVHQVTLTQAFYLGRYEVTQAQWTAVMGSNPSSFQGFPDSPSRPIDGISWAMAQSFTNSTGLRLPTEAEWEYACRGGTVSAFNNGTDDDSTMTTLGWTQVNSGGQPRPVGLKLANNLGLYDMHGNIWEWVSDWYSPEYYSGSSGVDPVGPSSGTVRVLRGGSWVYNSLFCRSSNRYDPPPGFNLYNCGFRVARTP